MRPCTRPDGEVGKGGLHRLEGLERGLQLQRLGLLDEGADPVGLRALGAALADAPDHLVAPRLVHELRDHGRAPRGQLVDDRHVEVRVVAHRERARNRGRAHHELVRLGALAGEGEPLRHAETVLLVDDGEPQAVEGDLVLEERVRADRELRLALRDRLQGGLLRARLEAAREPAHLHAQRLQPVRELQVVLLGQDLRGRHERHLPAVLDRLQGREGGDERLAAAHVALQQPAHGMRLREVVGDGGPGLLLRPREGEGQRLHQRVGERVPVRHARRRLAAALAVGDAHGELLREELVELQAPPGRVRALGEARRVHVRRRAVQEQHAFAEGAERQALEERGLQRVVEQERVERVLDEPPQVRLRHPGGRGVDRREGGRERRVLLHHAHLGMDHLGAEESRPHLAEEAKPPARRHLLHLARVEVEEAHPEVGPAVGEPHHQRAPRAVLDVGLDHVGLDEHRLARSRLGERRELRLVLVAQGQVQHEVEARVDAELGELRADGGAGDEVAARRGRRRGGLGGSRRARGTRGGHGRRLAAAFRGRRGDDGGGRPVGRDGQFVHAGFFFRRERRTTSGMRRMRRKTCARCMRFLTWMVKTIVV